MLTSKKKCASILRTTQVKLDVLLKKIVFEEGQFRVFIKKSHIAGPSSNPVFALRYTDGWESTMCVLAGLSDVF